MGEKLILDVLKGQKTRRVPFWFMRQAGRYLPEYRELRAEKGGFLDMVYDPEAAAEITLQPIRRFGMDAAILFSDILVIPHALGQNLEFVPGEGPKLEPIQSAADLAKLDPGKIDDVLGPVYETVSHVRAGLSKEGFDRTALIGFAGSPWTVACYMVEGAGSKDFMRTKVMAYAQPELFQKIIDLVAEATIHYLKGQVEAGAEALQLFDSWAGVLDADQFRRWSIEPTKKIVAGVRQAYPDIPIIGFPKGAGLGLGDYVDQTGVSAAGLDSQIAPLWAAQNLQDKVPVQGNLDPFCLYAGGDMLERSARAILEALGSKPFIFNLGHGIHKDTPIAHVERLVQIIREY